MELIEPVTILKILKEILESIQKTEEFRTFKYYSNYNSEDLGDLTNYESLMNNNVICVKAKSDLEASIIYFTKYINE